jgi:hypothetical protein
MNMYVTEFYIMSCLCIWFFDLFYIQWQLAKVDLWNK